MSQTRSDPDSLLKKIQQAEEEDKKGKLKVYLGAAPGVGKTYKMLHDAYQSRLKNLDVVVGIVESHHRQEIEKILNNFEILPLQKVRHRDNLYTEFDLDGALKRAPGLILVDEMAHSNVAGLRHQKRWQDIKELLDRGIDVYTTLNVQHIESLKDNVAQIIQAPVQETVPDFMLESAHSIELVDLPVEDLLKRLKEGKIYFAEQASLAAAHFFREGNLIALRELALRVTANCVDTDVLAYRRATGIGAIWPTADKILVCVGSSPESSKLIRIAKQLASSLHAEWMAVYVDRPSVFLSQNKRNHAMENLRLAEQLGADTHVVMGRDVVKELLQFARRYNITQMMLSKDRSLSWRYFFQRRLADELIAQSGEINIYIVGITKKSDTNQPLREHPNISWYFYGLSISALGLVTGIGKLLTSLLATNVIALCYLLVVMLIAVLGQGGPAILSCFLSVLAFDYFFVNPMYSFKLLSAESLIPLSLLFLISLSMSFWMVLKYREAKIARDIQQQTRAAYDFSQKLLRTRGLQEILALGAEYIAESLLANVIILIPKEGHLKLEAGYPKSGRYNEKDQGIAEWVYDIAQPAGLGTDTLSSSDALFIPLRFPSKPVIGVLKIQPQKSGLFSPDQRRILESFVNQLALALEVDHLQDKLTKKQLKQEIDSAKNALLKTISVQLNYPLKFILDFLGPSIPQNVTMNPLKDMNDELNKISLINNNIIQIIEFESDDIKLNKKTVELTPLLQETLKLLDKIKLNRTIELHCPPYLPTLVLDPLRIQEVFLNLLDNSIKYSPDGSVIDIYLQLHQTHVLISIENTGSAIKRKDLSKIFDPFYRSIDSEHQDSLGLGLTYCQINIQAHGGQIWAENLNDDRVAFHFTLPL